MTSCGGGNWDSYSTSSKSRARQQKGGKKKAFSKKRKGATVARGKGKRRDSYASRRKKGPSILAFRDSYSVKNKKRKRDQYGNSQRKYRKRTKQRKHRLKKRSQQGIFQ